MHNFSSKKKKLKNPQEGLREIWILLFFRVQTLFIEKNHQIWPFLGLKSHILPSYEYKCCSTDIQELYESGRGGIRWIFDPKRGYFGQKRVILAITKLQNRLRTTYPRLHL